MIAAGQLEAAQKRYNDMLARNEFDSYTVAIMMRAYMHTQVPVFVKAVRVYRAALGKRLGAPVPAHAHAQEHPTVLWQQH